MKGMVEEMLDEKEIRFILSLVSDKYGWGYTDKVENGFNIGMFQAKLSVMLQVQVERKS